MSLSQKWKDTVDDGITNKAWDTYDDLIKTEVTAYNTKFASTSGYARVDWLLMKAMVWVESGGPASAAWKAKVMQIGNQGDPGYAVLKSGSEGASLIMSSQLANEIKTQKIDDPTLNVKAGIAYLFTRMVKVELQSINDAKDTKVYDHKVLSGQSFAVIAPKVGTTVACLQALNPAAKVIHPGQVLKYRKAKMGTVITGWRPFSASTIASRYNVGDPDYGAKLEYCLELFKKLKR